MFTGIVQEIGIVAGTANKDGNVILEIESRKIFRLLDIGASISINGACQTVISRSEHHFKVESIKETLSRTNFNELRAGSHVNLEAPLSLNDLLHGHLVQGHIDCTSRITEIRPVEGSSVLSIEYPPEYKKYLIEKGSIAIDGVSLTLMDLTSEVFRVSIIPQTMSNTIFLYKKVGDTVNLEFDMIAKYVEKMVSPGESRITIDFLKEHGF